MHDYPYMEVCNDLIKSIYNKCNGKRILIDYKELIRYVLIGVVSVYDIETMGTSVHTKKVVDELLEVVEKELLKKGYFR